MKTYLSITALFALATTGSAQEKIVDTLKTASLEQVVVTGQFEPQSLKKSIYNLRVITKEDIKRLAANNLADVLSQSLNIIIRPSGSDGRSAISLFGLDGQYFKILQDNVPMVSDAGLGNNIDLTQINLNDIERIEIIEGSMGVTHGANAVSGILNIITKKGSDTKWELSATVQEETAGAEYAPFKAGKHIQGLKAGHKFSENWYASLSFNRNDFDGFKGDRSGPDHVPNDGTRGYQWLPDMQYSASSMLSYAKDDFRFFYKSEYFREKTAFYNATVNAVNNPPFEPIRTADDSRYFTTRLYNHANISGRLESGLRYNVSASYQNQKRETEDFEYNLNTKSESGSTKYKDQSSVVLYSTGTLSHFFMDKKYDLQLGYEFNGQNGFSKVIAENNFVKDVRRQFNNYDIFLSGEYAATEKLSLRPGARYSFQSVFDNQYAASLGFRYLLPKQVELRTSFGKSFRTPNFEEMYSELIFSGHYFIGNENLLPENSTSYEASIRKTFSVSEKSSLSTVLTANLLSVKDRISMALISVAPIAKSQYINISKYSMWNVAVTNQFRYGEFSANGGASLIGISQRLDNNEAVSDDRYLYTFQGTANVSYSILKWESALSVFYKYNGKQQTYISSFDEEGNPVFKPSTVSPFSLMDASIRKTFYKHYEVTLGVRNILDVTSVRQTSANAGATHPTSDNVMFAYGRSYFIKLTYNLNF
ncbi:MAG: TonB-dependent receptor [Flavobacterium sp. BFFFF1]|uniref:TonB-dependent receptor plug domain-containing protein n=1 Tax=Flavobacterium sp. BFFFF1 TaxID=2015557 RepID=UPI000BCCA99D|nr:TonB-dependent receptor [Flavobacterium sp. BFFFF1]OYU81548.1 MAG: TonB-dependent receptor [Flavobacterium sp. BFFFF1]